MKIQKITINILIPNWIILNQLVLYFYKFQALPMAIKMKFKKNQLKSNNMLNNLQKIICNFKIKKNLQSVF